jgi:uncharacterized membrane protein
MGEKSNPLGITSLVLGIVAAALVFGIGTCGLVAANQGWIRVIATPLFVCGASSTFLAFIGLITGITGLWGDRPKATAAVGLVLGIIAICLFIGAVNTIANLN